MRPYRYNNNSNIGSGKYFCRADFFIVLNNAHMIQWELRIVLSEDLQSQG